MTVGPSANKPPGITTIEDVTCLGCGCLCDDLVVSVDGPANRVVEIERACDLGRALFLNTWPPVDDEPNAWLDGIGISPQLALDQAAGWLRSARSPMILGWSRLTIDAQRAGVALAERLRARVVLGSPDSLLAFQSAGQVGGTLGEVRDRARAVLFWEADPLSTHPRHGERFSIEPIGRFLPRGRADRAILVATSSQEPTATSRVADHLLTFEPSHRFALIWTLRALALGRPLSAPATLEATGLDLQAISAWFEPMRESPYSAIFHDLDRLGLPESHAIHEALLLLSRDLASNENRCAIASLGGAGNPSGAEHVLAWQTGVTGAVDFASGEPRFLPWELDLERCLLEERVDLLMMFDDSLLERLSAAAQAAALALPRLIITHGDARVQQGPSVVLECSRPGLDEAGSVRRGDGVVLPLRQVLASQRPTAADWIRLLLARLESRDSSTVDP